MSQQIINTRRAINGILSFLVLAAVLALVFQYRHRVGSIPVMHISFAVRDLPYFAYCSWLRMLAAYLIALIFSIFYGFAAARSPASERILIPAVDIAQSVPVVGFFPAAVFFFVSLAHGHRIGVEMAAVFLIFTSQAWNMTLGVYESVKTIPADSMEVLDAFGAGGWLRMRRLLLPASVPKLVYNSILSWVSGWYFLIACEIITVGPASYRLPGLGSFLMDSAERGDWSALVAGLLTLLAIIVAMDLVIWQPLSNWAEKFRYEFAAAPQVQGSLGMIAVVGWIAPVVTRGVRSVTRPVARAIFALIAITPVLPRRETPTLRGATTMLRYIAGAAFVVLLSWAMVDGLRALVRTLAQPWPPEAKRIPLATVLSALRITAAYLISLAWTLPAALVASENPQFRRILSPVAEIVGAMPATALFPLIVVVVIEVTGGMNLASILLIITGMQWYLLFNLLAGVNSVPEDLKEAARSFGLSRFATARKLTIPALMPSLITGSITAWGGGWNALILSEYFVYRRHTYQVEGLGALLDEATYRTGNGVMILLSLLAMCGVVILLNRGVWRRLYDAAAERYRIDY